ncbi:MAG: YdcF family protein [Oscillospiraceae bacterium]|nr:YdcF family protein [Oscillospiraceae bacterium]
MSYQTIWNGRSGYGGRKHTLRNILLILLALGVLCFAALEVYIGLHSRTTGERTGPGPQVMVIFGCKVEPWGPSVLLQDRLDTALDYLKDHPDMTVVVTGGKGDDEHISEAQCMYDYLTEHGVDGGNIYLEDRSRNTWQNVNYTLELLGTEVEAGRLAKPQGYVLVSSGFHLSRIQMLWARAGGTGEPSTLAAPVSHTPSAIQMFFREPLALVKSFVFDR